MSGHVVKLLKDLGPPLKAWRVAVDDVVVGVVQEDRSIATGKLTGYRYWLNGQPAYQAGEKYQATDRLVDLYDTAVAAGKITVVNT